MPSAPASQGQNQLNGIISSVITPSFTFSSLDRAVGPHSGKDFNVAVQIAGAGGNVKYISPVASWRQFFPMKGLKVNREGHNVLGYRVQFAHISGFGGEVAPPTHRIYGGGEYDVRGFDVRSASPYTFIPNKVMFNLTNPDGTTVPRDPTNPALGNVQIPLPLYRMVSIGGDTSVTANLEYRIPIVNQVTFAFFTDFGMTFDVRSRPACGRASPVSQEISSPLVWLPELHQRRLLRRQAGHVPAIRCESFREPTMFRVCRTVRSCRSSCRSSTLRSVLLRLQLAAPVRGRSPGFGDGSRDIPGLLPELGSRAVQLSAGDPASTERTTSCVSRERPSA